MEKLLKIARNQIWRVVGLLLIDIAFFGSTNSSNVASYLVIVGFILLILSFYEVIYYLLNFIKLYGVPIKRKKRLAAYITAVLGALVALQSIGELSPKDVLVLLPLAIVGYGYSSYAKPNRAEK